MEKYCECGCGEIVKAGNRFIRGHNSFGHVVSDETKQKIGNAHRGKIVSEEQKHKLRDANLGKKLSDETKMKIGAKSKGNSYAKGHHHTEETKQKIGIASKERGFPKEHMANWVGKQHSDEAKLRMSISHMKSRKDGYCDVWSDNEYKNDLRKSSCEECGITNMMSLKLFGTQLHTHHKHGKTQCSPNDIQTLCNSCHIKLHYKIKHMLDN